MPVERDPLTGRLRWVPAAPPPPAPDEGEDLFPAPAAAPAAASTALEPEPSGFRKYAPAAIRGLSGLLAFEGGIPGAAIGGAGEGLAQFVEGDFNAPQIAMQAGLSAIPFGKAATLGRAALKGGVLGATGGAGTELAEQFHEHGFDLGDYDTAAIESGAKFGGVVGGVAGGAGHAILGRFLGAGKGTDSGGGGRLRRIGTSSEFDLEGAPSTITAAAEAGTVPSSATSRVPYRGSNALGDDSIDVALANAIEAPLETAARHGEGFVPDLTPGPATTRIPYRGIDNLTRRLPYPPRIGGRAQTLEESLIDALEEVRRSPYGDVREIGLPTDTRQLGTNIGTAAVDLDKADIAARRAAQGRSPLARALGVSAPSPAAAGNPLAGAGNPLASAGVANAADSPLARLAALDDLAVASRRGRLRPGEVDLTDELNALTSAGGDEAAAATAAAGAAADPTVANPLARLFRISAPEFSGILSAREQLENKLAGLPLPAGFRDQLDRLGLEYRRTRDALAALRADPNADPRELQRLAQARSEVGARLSGMEREAIRVANDVPPDVARESYWRGELGDWWGASDRGALGSELAMALGSGALGGATGGALDPEHPLQGAALGALLGVAAPVAARSLGRGRTPAAMERAAATLAEDVPRVPQLDARIAPGGYDSRFASAAVIPERPLPELPASLLGNERGEIDPSLLYSLLSGTLGAGAGAYFDPENRTRGAALGAALGAGAPAVIRNPQALERLRFFSLLSSPLTHAKNVLGNVGALGAQMAERSLAEGSLDPAKNILRAVFDPETVAAATRGFESASHFANNKLGVEVPREGLLALPGRLMSGMDAGARNALERAGLTGDEASRAVYTGEPLSEIGKGLLQFQRRSALARLILPFVKTPINLFEMGIERSPLGLKRLLEASDPLTRRLILAQAGLGTGAAALGAEYGADNPYLTALAGPYALPFAAGTAYGLATDAGDNETKTLQAVTDRVLEQLPLTFSTRELQPSRLLASFVPNLLRDLNPDPYRRDTTGTVFGPLLAKLPFLSETLPSRGRKKD